MPLACDCYGGCWGDHSEGWPEVPFTDAAWKRAVEQLPYGSYVRVRDDSEPKSEATWRAWTGQRPQLGVIRIEQEEYRAIIA